ncbi:hypothetical protein M6B38_360950 [Iris pallida]|uniref:Uncharacterized protein n=1 Tax=Iris pallida TaxID=29817 RepID=A0AAX6GKR5_IRIPA|nr:hypothetical protein M6B38_105285 [Iris pallida]KAJ6829280.1 hypothetical protein M6B38_360950 [Iris pallida]
MLSLDSLYLYRLCTRSFMYKLVIIV